MENKTIEVITKAFYLEVRGEENSIVAHSFEIEKDHHAESILRGFVHSGYKVSIREVYKTEVITMETFQEWQMTDKWCMPKRNTYFDADAKCTGPTVMAENAICRG